MKRLFTLSSRLAYQLQEMPVEQQRNLRNLACAFAVQAADLHEQVVLDSLDALDCGATIDSASKFQLEELLRDFDSRYIDCSEKSADGEDDGIEYFQKARAIAALIETTRDSWLDAVFDSIYEAAMAASNQQELISKLLTLAGCSDQRAV